VEEPKEEKPLPPQKKPEPTYEELKTAMELINE